MSNLQSSVGRDRCAAINLGSIHNSPIGDIYALLFSTSSIFIGLACQNQYDSWEKWLKFLKTCIGCVGLVVVKPMKAQGCIYIGKVTICNTVCIENRFLLGL